MANTDELLRQFYSVFGDEGGALYPGNIGVGRTAHAVCHEIMDLPGPVLYDHFTAWDNREDEARRLAEQEAKIAELKSADAEQRKEIRALTAALKEQAAQIQKVSCRVEMRQPATRIVSNRP